MKEVCIPQIKYFLSLKFISLVCDLRQVGGFLRFPPPMKLNVKL